MWGLPACSVCHTEVQGGCQAQMLLCRVATGAVLVPAGAQHGDKAGAVHRHPRRAHRGRPVPQCAGRHPANLPRDPGGHTGKSSPCSSLPLDIPHHLCGLKKLQDTHKRHRHVRRVTGVWLLHWFYLPVRLCCLPWLNAGAIASDSAKQMEPQFYQWGPIFCTRSHNDSATIFIKSRMPLLMSSAPFTRQPAKR